VSRFFFAYRQDSAVEPQGLPLALSTVNGDWLWSA